jgi:hypothetical protein
MIYDPNFPEILQTKFKISDNTRQRMIDAVLSQKDTGNYYGGYTFRVVDTEQGDFKKLYNYTIECIETVFGKLMLAPKNRSWCWANVYNKDSFRTNMHDHKGTCSINAIYYLKMPNGIANNEGGLSLVQDEKLYGTFQPDEGDLIIMPSYVPHEPQYHSSTDYRIAINMEIATFNHNSKYYTKENIYANATIL